MAELITTLLSFSERAGEIARAIRQEPKLFALLVEEKGEGEKNQRFAHDFKTLADVLIQEALRHHVARTVSETTFILCGEYLFYFWLCLSFGQIGMHLVCALALLFCLVCSLWLFT